MQLPPIPQEVQFLRSPPMHKEHLLPRLNAGGNKKARLHFANGLAILYCFNQQLAAQHFVMSFLNDRSMRVALAFAAYSLSMNVNHVEVDQNVMRFALGCLQTCLSLKRKHNEIWWAQAFIDAVKARMIRPNTQPLDARNVNPQGSDLKQKMKRWLAAVKRLHKLMPLDEDIAVLRGAAYMQQSPWRWWPQGSMYDAHLKGPAGKVAPGQIQAISYFMDTLTQNPHHVGALHYFIHAVEESPFPDFAFGAAVRIEQIFQDMGHIGHMPSHIYARVGDYWRSIACNKRAIADDVKLIKRIEREHKSPALSYYAKEYPAHNTQFLLDDAVRLFNSKLVRRYGPYLTKHVLKYLALSKENDFMQHFLSAEHECKVMLGNYSDVLRAATPSHHYKIFQLNVLLCKCIAACRLGKKSIARQFMLMTIDADNNVFHSGGHVHMHSCRKGGIANPHTGATHKLKAESSSTVAGTKTVDNSGVLSKLHQALVRGEFHMRFGPKHKGLSYMRKAWMAYMTLKYDEPASFWLPLGCSYAKALFQCGEFAAMSRPLSCENRAYPNRPRVTLLRLLQARKIYKDRVPALVRKLKNEMKHADTKLTFARI